MINVGEQIVSSYLKYICGCDLIQTNLYTAETQGEIDVVGINLEKKMVYVCEVAIHLATGLQYTKDKRPNNIHKLTEKLSRDITYAEANFPSYKREYMVWSPIVKNRKNNPVYDQIGHTTMIGNNIQGKHSVKVVFVVNDKFQECLQEMRDYARKQTAELKCPIMRLFQIEEQLKKHMGSGG
jgi:hypothetical protein